MELLKNKLRKLPLNRIKQLTLSRDKAKAKATKEAQRARNLAKKLARRDARIIALEGRLDLVLAENAQLKMRAQAAVAPSGSHLIDFQFAIMMRILCVMLILRGVISFKSCPRILQVCRDQGLLPQGAWIPHFTSIIRWTQRYGLYKLNAVTTRDKPWVAILDQSIGIGLQKVLVILRVSLDHFTQYGRALTLEDCECIQIEVRESWTGETVCKALHETFKKTGNPRIILKDQGSDLARGVRLWRESVGKSLCRVVDDIGHYSANALKSEFSKLKGFNTLLLKVRSATRKLKQSSFFYLAPPKLRTAGRFMSISRLAKWAETMLSWSQTPNADPEIPRVIRRATGGFSKIKTFIDRFNRTAQAVNKINEILKNKGLNQKTYHEAKTILNTLPKRSGTRKRLQKWLNRGLDTQCQLGIKQTPIPVSTDIIESLFGKFKMQTQRQNKAEINQMVLTIPAMTGINTREDIAKALGQVQQKDLLKWAKEHIPKTRQAIRRSNRALARPKDVRLSSA